MRTVRRSKRNRVAKCQRVTFGIHGVWSVPLVRSETVNSAWCKVRLEPNAEENRKQKGEIRMDAVEFAKTIRKMCESHTTCESCELKDIQGRCNISSLRCDREAVVEAVERWKEEHKYDVTPSAMDELRGKRNALEIRFAAAMEKLDELIGKAGAGYPCLCDSTRKNARENYDSAWERIENYNDAMDEAEDIVE